MSRVLPAVDICGQALGAIGAWPVTESAPDAEQLRRAMTFLDLLMGETVGTERLFSRVEPTTMSMPIVNGTSSYVLYTALGADLPTDKIQFVVDAWLQDDLGNRKPVEITTRQKFEDVCKPSETGLPCWVYIDRTDAPTLRIYPTPASTDPRTYTLKLVGQRYAPNVAPSGVTGTRVSASAVHDFGQAWQRWLVFQLAHDLGSGPIHKLPEPSLVRFKGMADQAKVRLLAFENREHETTPPVGDSWDISEPTYWDTARHRTGSGYY